MLEGLLDSPCSSSGGSLTVNGYDTITYFPAPNFSARDFFSYFIQDLSGAVNEGDVDVSVFQALMFQEPNHCPSSPAPSCSGA
jgi:hypothetical protein